MRTLLAFLFCVVLLVGCQANEPLIIKVKTSKWEEGFGGHCTTHVVDVHDRKFSASGRYDFTPGETYSVVFSSANNKVISSIKKISSPEATATPDR